MIIFVAFVLATAFLMAVASLFVAIVPPFTGAIVVRMGKPIRSIGPGTNFIFRPIEWIGECISLKEKVIDDKMTAETEDEEVVSIDYSIEYAPYLPALITFLGFTKDQVESAIKQRVKSLLSIAVRKRKDRDAVYDQISYVAQEVQTEFLQTFSNQYGVYLRFMIDDPELPKELAEAEVKREIQEKENERREIEMVKMRELAKAMVEDSKLSGKPMTFEKALEKVQIQFKIVPEERKIFGLDSDTNAAIGGVLGGAAGALGGILDKIFPKMNPKRKTQKKKES